MYAYDLCSEITVDECSAILIYRPLHYHGRFNRRSNYVLLLSFIFNLFEKS
jgi:hypothetical protein